MKKILFTIAISLIVFSASAQKNDSLKITNEVAIVLTDIINGTYQINYERAVGRHISIGAGFGLKGKEGLVNLSGLDTEKIKTSDLTYAGFKIIPEVRYYLHPGQKNNLKGFYFGAYLKYGRYHSDLFGTYINNSQEAFLLDFDVNINITSLGFMVGYKLPVYKNFSIDFLIAGPGAGFHSYSIKSNTTIPDSFYDDINEALDKYTLFDLINADFKFSDLKANTNFMVPSFRYALSVSYSF